MLFLLLNISLNADDTIIHYPSALSENDPRNEYFIDLLQITRASFNRKELYYQVTPKVYVKEQMLSYIKNHKDETGITNRLSRKDVERIAEFLIKNGVKALPYHAGLSKDVRNSHQE